MASRIEGLDEVILRCAEQEFLEKGFTEASLRTIAQNAGVSTSTIYTRYSDKEGLFRFLIKPAAEGIREYVRRSLQGFSELPEEEQTEQYEDYSEQGFPGLVSCIYEHYNALKLLITCAPGTIYQDFLESLVELDTSCTRRFLEQIGSSALTEGRITDGFLHVVSSAFYAGIFEVVIHDMPRQEAEVYINELRNFYSNGWKTYF